MVRVLSMRFELDLELPDVELLDVSLMEKAIM
jgi:hypothetical protein